MRAVIQRVSRSAVRVGGSSARGTGRGLVILIGITHDDGPDDIRYIADKSLNMRLFPAEGEEHGFDRSALEVGAGLLLVSQFTLHASTRKGRRPSFTAAAPADVSGPIFEQVVDRFRQSGLAVETGVFGAYMDVELVNAGPVTILLDSADRHTPRRQAD